MVEGVVTVVALQLRTIEKRSQSSFSMRERERGRERERYLMVEYDQVELLIAIYNKKKNIFN